MLGGMTVEELGQGGHYLALGAVLTEKKRPHGPPAKDKRTQKVLARYYDEIKAKQPGKSKEYYARVAWQRYCMYKNPDNPSCGPAGKSKDVTTGPKAEDATMSLDSAFEAAVDGAGGLAERKPGAYENPYAGSDEDRAKRNRRKDPRGSGRGRKKAASKAARRGKKKEIDARMRGESSDPLDGARSDLLDVDPEGAADDASIARIDEARSGLLEYTGPTKRRVWRRAGAAKKPPASGAAIAIWIGDKDESAGVWPLDQWKKAVKTAQDLRKAGQSAHLGYVKGSTRPSVMKQKPSIPSSLMVEEAALGEGQGTGKTREPDADLLSQFKADPKKARAMLKKRLGHAVGGDQILKHISHAYDAGDVPNAVYSAAAALARVADRADAAYAKKINAMMGMDAADKIAQAVRDTSYGSISNFERWWKKKLAEEHGWPEHWVPLVDRREPLDVARNELVTEGYDFAKKDPKALLDMLVKEMGGRDSKTPPNVHGNYIQRILKAIPAKKRKVMWELARKGGKKYRAAYELLHDMGWKKSELDESREALLGEGINQGGVAGPWCAPGYYEHPPKTDPTQGGGMGREPRNLSQKTVEIGGASEGWYAGHYDRIKLVREGDQVNVGPYAFEVKQAKHEPGMVKLILQAGDGGLRDQFEMVVPETPRQEIALVDYGGRTRDFGIGQIGQPDATANQGMVESLDDLFENTTDPSYPLPGGHPYTDSLAAGGQMGSLPRPETDPSEVAKRTILAAQSAIESFMGKRTSKTWRAVYAAPTMANNLFMGKVVRQCFECDGYETEVNVSTRLDGGKYPVTVRCRRRGGEWEEQTMRLSVEELGKPARLMGAACKTMMS